MTPTMRDPPGFGDLDGMKHPLAVVEGDTENTRVVMALLVGLRERGRDTSRPVLVVLEGATALTAAVSRVFDHPVIARCQQNKIANLKNRLPERLKSVAGKRMRARTPPDREEQIGSRVGWPAGERRAGRRNSRTA
jgi:hypothetical protein